MNKYIVILTTTTNKKEAKKITEFLVKKKLVGCAQVVGPIESTYWWKGKIERSKEWLCILKTKRSLFAKIEKEIKKVHSYTVPQILAVPVASGSRDYLRWLDKSTL